MKWDNVMCACMGFVLFDVVILSFCVNKVVRYCYILILPFYLFFLPLIKMVLYFPRYSIFIYNFDIILFLSFEC